MVVHKRIQTNISYTVWYNEIRFMYGNIPSWQTIGNTYR